MALCLAGCDEEESLPEPTPTSTPRPTSTPPPLGVVDQQRFVITLDGRLLAVEELRARLADGTLIIDSVLTWAGPDGPVERRSVALSPLLYPTQYSFERNVRGVTSSWVARRQGEHVDSVANNMAWFAPVAAEGLSPAPGALFEGMPSALPFALLALQFTNGRTPEDLAEPMHVPVLEVTEDLPSGRDLTLSVALDQGNAVIGTMALDGSIAGAANDVFTLWMRPDSRLVFGVELPDYRFGFWEQIQCPALRERGTVRIERVKELPVLPEPTLPAAIPEQIIFEGTGGALAAQLYRPAAEVPAPAVVLYRGWDLLDVGAALDAIVAQGWAVFVVDPAGVGASEGTFRRAPSGASAEDLRRAAQTLADRADIDARRVVLLALGDSATVGALALAADQAGEDPKEQPFAGAVLGAFATDEPMFPELASDRVLTLQAFYRWRQEDTTRYLDHSIRQWEQWQASGQESVAMLGRRLPLDALEDWATVDVPEALAQVTVPVLVLHGAEDTWVPADGAMRLMESLQAGGDGQYAYQIFDGLGHDLGRRAGLLWDEAVDQVVWDWIDSLP